MVIVRPKINKSFSTMIQENGVRKRQMLQQKITLLKIKKSPNSMLINMLENRRDDQMNCTKK